MGQERLPGKAIAPLRQIWKRVGSAILALVGLASASFALYEVRPKVQITSFDSLDERDPFQTRFSVTNNSTFSIKKGTTICHLNNVEAANGSITDIGIGQSLLPTGHFDTLESGKSATVPCAEAIRLDTISSADITIEIDFAYTLWWKRIKTKSRFVTEKSSSGTLRWFPQPDIGN